MIKGRVSPPFFLFCNAFNKADGVGQVPLVGPPLRDAAHQLERTEGVITGAAEFSQNVRVSGLGDLPDGLRSAFLSGAAGVDEKDLFPLRQGFLRETQDTFMELGVVDAGGEANQIVLLQGSAFHLCGVDERQTGPMASRTFFVLPWWRE